MKLLYSKEHEWIKFEIDDESIVTVGISEHAQESLGDIVYVELPEIGKICDAGQEVAVVESAKAASDIYSPVSGEVVECNEKLENSPELLNESPLEEGWLYKIKISQPNEIDALMSEEEYINFVSSS